MDAPPARPRADAAPWWRTAVIYQVYPRSFADANGDGIGDLPGIRDRLTHLRDLGVDAVWLSPFYRSPQVDAGYDVSDYRDVDPMFGTLADFDALVAEAHRLGLRVIIDVVANHTSDQHPWFAEALASEPGSAARERYLFRPGKGATGEKPPNDWESVFGGSAWTRVADGEWYLHLFDPAQPDLNWRDLEVRGEFEDVLRFWLDRGVDGFRVDVAHGMIKADGLPDVGPRKQVRLLGKGDLPFFDQDDVHDIYRSWRKILDGYPGQRMAVAEAWASTYERLSRYVAYDELHQAFNFEFLRAPWDAVELRGVIDQCLASMGAVGAPTTWVLSNHDKRRHVTRFGGGEAGLRRARAAVLLMLALPGSAYLYQGEELGLPEVLDLPDQARQDPIWLRSGGAEPGRDGCRVPLPWSGDAPPYGFGPASSTPWLPQPADWAELTAAAQHGDPASMLTLYRAALRTRREHPALGQGSSEELEWLPAPVGVLAFRRAGAPSLVCAVNLTDAPVDLAAAGIPVTDAPLLASSAVAGGMLPPDTAAWWSVAG
ncbi:glycoside hydrolase family 13 protein [Couchioplanes caeruleus]|uniref:Glycosyl hydrolase family 13 catalytic domain-containing protein n=1 Tax=Couchioplanes caeruleus subsp. caeruleus TaxID=56427 RepID=A0A1K0GXD7_9ACTN|nr:glycoside hydrolase family 13 protein [Couchioplanes caeruleus]OJF14091.1 hypothetical protein BG844_11670 [Couchioplanes caeruleus subsp. caeruleus]